MRHENARYLVAGWAFACGMAYPSFFHQALHLDEPDPSSIPTIWVVVLKGAGFALAIVALIGALRRPRAIRDDGLVQHPERLEQMLDATDDA
jgi:MYXO-CTERM domain-containing protein